MLTALADTLGVVVVVVFWSAALLPVVVATFWKWWREPFGQSYMVMDILLAMALAPGALHRMFGLDDAAIWYLWFSIVIIGLIAPAIWWRCAVLWITQRSGRSLNPYVAVRDWNRNRKLPPVAGP